MQLALVDRAKLGDGKAFDALARTVVDVDGSIVWIDGETFQGAGPGPAGDPADHRLDRLRVVSARTHGGGPADRRRLQ